MYASISSRGSSRGSSREPPIPPSLIKQKYRVGQTQLTNCHHFSVYGHHTIPVNLTRERTNTIHSQNYFTLNDWLNFMIWRSAADETMKTDELQVMLDELITRDVQKCENWFISGLMTSYRDERPSSYIIPYDVIKTAVRQFKSDIVKKQMLCKLISEDTIVCAFNITGSDKMVSIAGIPRTSLNVFFKNKLVFIKFYYSTDVTSGLSLKVKKILLYDTIKQTVKDLTKKREEENSNLMNIISQRPLYVIDPNRVVNENTHVEWFGERGGGGGMTIQEIDTLVAAGKDRIDSHEHIFAGGRRKIRNNTRHPKYKKTKKRRYNNHSSHSNRSTNDKLKHNKSKKSVRT